jgi:hypothetical protein
MVTSRLSRLSSNRPRRTVGWLKPLLRRTTACLTTVGLVDDGAGGFQHDRYATRSDQILFHQQDTHAASP